MFDLFAMILSSITSFLFPIFASYKALKTSDPAQLTPWLMYWVVFSICLLAESWVYFILTWIPFYGYIRLLFLLYLILPQTQGARLIYEEKIHPWLEENETQIDEFITSAHNRLTAAGIRYVKLAIEAFKTKVLGLPPSDPTPPSPEPQSYTQSLISRFSVPAARWAGTGSGAGAGNSGSDFYSLLSSAVAAATGATGLAGASGAPSNQEVTNSGTLIPPHLRDSTEKMSFIAAQRDRLNIVLSALDREADTIQRTETQRAHRRPPSMTFDGTEDDEPTQRPPSGLSAWSGLSRNRSEADFEKIDAESGTEDEGAVRRRKAPGGPTVWVPWGWSAEGVDPAPTGQSSSMER
ncbi:Fc.00g043860.m01.CDS01 [Cosmosporella sp. VM-42]